MIYVLLGASGSGKSTIASQLDLPEIKSHTTRKKRSSEGGQEYYFVSKDIFMNTKMIESVEYSGNLYGVSYEEVQKYITKDIDCYVILDKNGCKMFKDLFKDKVKIIYIYSSKELCEFRMLKRGDSIDDINKRLKYAEDNNEYNNHEIADFVIVNDIVNLSVKILKKYIYNNKKRVYLSGKISGLEEEVYIKRFTESEAVLKNMGYINIISPINIKPHKNIPSWENYMINCIKELVTCKEVYVIKDMWKESKGVMVEINIAESLNIPVKFIE